MATVHVTSRSVEIVVKVGGGTLRHPDDFRAVLDVVAAAARTTRLLIVPGGGPFADAVREADRVFRLTDRAAHWMAVLAMDQHAHLLVSRLPAGTLVSARSEIESAIGAGRIPVLAPSSWLQAEDPLPHSWEVTSDSIAAWVAGAVGAKKLVLVKPPHAAGPGLVDGYFDRVRAAELVVEIVSGDRINELRVALARRD